MATQKEIYQRISNFLLNQPESTSSEIFTGIAEGQYSYATVKRAIKAMVSFQELEVIGASKATRYRISKGWHVLTKIDPQVYFETEIDERPIYASFNFDLIENTLPRLSLFTTAELKQLDELQQFFTAKVEALDPTDYRSEFERLAIDLSWKSSQIEGNTYSLLETEVLLKQKEAAAGKTKEEATMLLNHKMALDFIWENADFVQSISIVAIEQIHSILIKDLPVKRNIRNRRVGITGTNYQPLQMDFQIREALVSCCALVNQKENVFEKALLILLLISYIQPFEDGNKRTARIISNAILVSRKACPLSFRTVSSLEYKKAMLIFYEQNNVSAFKRIFIDQCAFAVNTYF